MTRDVTRRNRIIKYTLIWVICAAIMFLPFLPGRKGLMIKDDGFNGYYPGMAFIGRWVKNILHGQFALYDFTLGYGDDVISTMNWGGLGDILLLPFCLVPESLLELSYTASILFRIYLAGLLFMLAVKKNIPDNAKVTGAIIYCFCPYVFKYAFRFLTMATPMVWLPVIVSGLKKIIEERTRFSKRLFLGVFFLSLTGFYYLYMAIIVFFVFLAICIVLDLVSKKSFYESVEAPLYVIGNTVLGILSAGVVLVPLTIHFFQSPRTSSIHIPLGDLFGFCKYMMELDRNVFLTRCDQMLLNGAQYDVLRLPIIQMLSIICLFYLIHHHKAIKRYRLLFCSLIAVVAIFSNAIALVMNAFSYTYERYFVFIFFAIAYMTAELMPQLRDNWDIIDTAFACVWAIANIVTQVVTSKESNAIIWCVILAIGSLLLVASLHMRWSIKVMSYLAIAWVILYGYIYNAPFEKAGNGFCGATYWLMHGAHDTVEASPLYNVEKSEKEFARYDLNGGALLASIMLDVPTTYSYYSICNGNMLPVLSEYGVSPAIQGSFIYEGLDERQIMESLFCVDSYNNGTNNDLPVKNEYALPFGVVYPSFVSEQDVMELTPLEKQILSLHALIIDREANAQGALSGEMVKSLVSEKAQIAEIESSIDLVESIELDGNTLIAQPDGSLAVRFDDPYYSEQHDDGLLHEVYLILPDFTSEDRVDILIDDKVLRIMPCATEQYLPSNDRYVNITDIAHDGKVELKFIDNSSCIYNGVKAVSVDVPDFATAINALKETSVRNLSIKNNSISGIIDTDAESIALFSIPFSKGWKAYIDGAPQSIIKADYGLLAVNVPCGEHSLVLEYSTPGIYLGAILSILGFISALIFYKSYKHYCN